VHCSRIPRSTRPTAIRSTGGSSRPIRAIWKIEQQIEHIIRWNAAAMVLRAYDSGSGVGGHIATYMSAATLLEVGFNHFFRAPDGDYGGDQVHVQAHAAPGIYARAFLEGRLPEPSSRELPARARPGGGLSSYPHPRRLPDFWTLPTASMGLSTPRHLSGALREVPRATRPEGARRLQGLVLHR
jgi:pyruvate dehydrogenase complex dehydrogenase (E1) component